MVFMLLRLVLMTNLAFLEAMDMMVSTTANVTMMEVMTALLVSMMMTKAMKRMQK